LAAVPTDYKAHYYRGEIYRRSGKNLDERMRAAPYYEKAVSLEPRFAEAHRALGILYFRVGEREKARSALRQYVRLACERDRVREPAKDCGAIREYLIELSLPQ
ncbi:MAG: tetratricopeptide repeat protein, partial [Nitrospinota bacterium]